MVHSPIAFGCDVVTCNGKVEVATASVVVQSCSGAIVEDDHGLTCEVRLRSFRLFNQISEIPKGYFGVEVAADDGVSIVDNWLEVAADFLRTVWWNVNIGYGEPVGTGMEFDGDALQILVYVVDALVVDSCFNEDGDTSAGLLDSGFALHGVPIDSEFGGSFQFSFLDADDIKCMG